MCFLWGEPRRKRSFSSFLIKLLAVPHRQEVKRMLFPLSFITSHLLVFQESMISSVHSNLLALQQTQAASVFPPWPFCLVSLFLFSFFLPYSVLSVEGSGNHMAELLVRDGDSQQAEREMECHVKKKQPNS